MAFLIEQHHLRLADESWDHSPQNDLDDEEWSRMTGHDLIYILGGRWPAREIWNP